MKPIIIVGAGPVGLTAALGLRFYGLPFEVFEEDEGLSSDTKAGTILTRTLEAFRRYGVVDEVLANALRIDEIGDDRVMVVPAPGVPGRMPFWRGDRPGRSAELGGRVGALARTIAKMPPKKAIEMLEGDHRLDERARPHRHHRQAPEEALTRAAQPDSSLEASAAPGARADRACPESASSERPSLATACRPATIAATLVR